MKMLDFGCGNKKITMDKEMRDSIKAAYLEFEKEPMDDYYNSPIFGVFSRQTVKKIIEELGHVKGKTVLDVGCEAGYVSMKIDKLGASTISFDICKPAIRTFKEKMVGERKKQSKIMIATAHSLPLKKNSIDFVVATGVVEHLPNLNSVFKELKRVLKRKGKIIITFPCESFREHFYPLIKFFGGIDTSVEKDVTLFSYSLKEMKRFCESFFVIKKLYTIPSPMFPITNIIVCEKELNNIEVDLK